MTISFGDADGPGPPIIHPSGIHIGSEGLRQSGGILRRLGGRHPGGSLSGSGVRGFDWRSMVKSFFGALAFLIWLVVTGT